MWISKKEYDRLVWSWGRMDALQTRCASQQTTNEWLMMRLTQLEHERAQLIQTYMGVKVPVPEMGTAVETTTVDQMLRDPGTLFRDVGDEEAKRLGLDWNDDGEVVYGKT